MTGKLRALGRADLVVGIPSFNSERTVGHVVRAVVAGLARHVRDARAVLGGSDGGSTDRTREIVERTEVGSLAEILVDAVPLETARIVTPYDGLPGKGSALRTVLRIAAELDARACAVVDADVRSITPEWVELLLAPVVRHGFDFVAPLYARHVTDGTITSTIVSPVTRALYGRRVREPMGGDFGFSGGLAGRFLEYDGWDGPVARYGVDVFMTTTALAEGCRVAQAFLGAKLHDAKDPGGDPSPMLLEVVSTLFSLMERYEPAWRGVKGSAAVPLFGFPSAVGLEPLPVRADRLAARFRRGAADLDAVFGSFLSTGSLERVAAAAATPLPSLGDEAWAGILWEAAAAFRRRALPPGTLIRALVPLYLGKVATFLSETDDASPEGAEARLEELALAFEAGKPQLLALWPASGRKEAS